MSMYRHGEVKVRRRMPVRRNEGAHLVRTKQHVPEVCKGCHGTGEQWFVDMERRRHRVLCGLCDGEGEA